MIECPRCHIMMGDVRHASADDCIQALLAERAVLVRRLANIEPVIIQDVQEEKLP